MKVLKMRHSYRFADGERIYFSSDDTRPKAYLFKRKFRYSVLTLKNVNLARDDNCQKSENVQILMKSPAIFPSQSQRVLFMRLAAHAIQKKYISLARAWCCIKLITLHCMIISPV